MRNSQIVCCMLIVACSGEKRAPDPQGRQAAVALSSPVEIRFYLGQPGIQSDIPVIERGAAVPYHWWRLSVPTRLLSDGNASLDLGSSIGVEYREYFTIAPGCGISAPPWLGIWNVGDPGVSGHMDLQMEGS